MATQLLLETARFSVVEHRYRSRGADVVKQTIKHPGAVVILPLLPDGRVLLIRNYRVAVDKTFIELPAGTLEPPEPPEQTARRELVEETGYSGERFTELPPFYMSPGILDERMYCFVAEGLTPGEAQPEAGEEIENLPTPLDDALAMIKRGEIEDAKTIVALLHYKLFGTGG